MTVKVDFQGLQKRITVFPFSSNRYQFVYDIGGKIVYGKGREIRIYDLKTKKDQSFISNISYGEFSADNKKLLYRGAGKWGIVDIRPKQKAGSGAINMRDLTMKIDPVKEWKQIFNEGWRIFRDWFYVYNMLGVDWQKMKQMQSKKCSPKKHSMTASWMHLNFYR